MERQKIFIISIDGATFTILDPFIRQGLLPNIRSFMERGLRADLHSTTPSVTPAAWTTFATGMDVQHHGIYHFLQFDAETCRFSFANTGLVPYKTFWEILSEHGLRSVILNLPMTYPPRAIHGVVVAGFDSPSIDAEFTYPRAVKQRIKRAIPDYDFVPSNQRDFRDQRDFDRFIQKARRALEQRFLLADLMLEEEKDWHLFMIHFQFIDQLQHAAWRYLDPSQKDLVNIQRTDACKKCFTDLDAYIGKLLERTQEAAPVRILMSDHGFGPMHLNVHMNNLLLEWGYLTYKARPAPSFGERVAKRLAHYRRRMLHSPGHRETRQATIDQLRKADTEHLPIDWDRTLCCNPIPNYTGMIYLNRRHASWQGEGALAGRVELLQTLQNRLLRVKHPATGKSVFREVIIHDTPATFVPDIHAIPEEGVFIHHEIHPTEIFSIPPAGNHYPKGIFAIQHPSIPAGTREESVAMRDVMPGILSLMHVDVPQNLDGHVPDFLPCQGKSASMSSRTSRKNALSEEESREVRDRLRALGYL